MKDYLIRGITTDKHIRFFAIKATELVNEAIQLHNLSVTNAVLLGRTLIAALLMGDDLKNDNDLLTIRIEGNGPSGVILVTATGKNTVKGYVSNPQSEFIPDKTDKSKISQAIGEGIISVIKSINDQAPYIGQTEIVSGEIAEDIAYYFMQSEQIPTAIQLGVMLNPDCTVKHAGGFLIQLLPNTPELVIDKLEKSINSFPNFTDLMDMNYSIEQLMEKVLLKSFEIDIKENHLVSYACNCSRERFYNGIKLLGIDEINALAIDKESISAVCHFCNKKYEFFIDDLNNMINEILVEKKS